MLLGNGIIFVCSLQIQYSYENLQGNFYECNQAMLIFFLVEKYFRTKISPKIHLHKIKGFNSLLIRSVLLGFLQFQPDISETIGGINSQ